MSKFSTTIMYNYHDLFQAEVTGYDVMLVVTYSETDSAKFTMQVNNVRKLHFQENLYKVFTKDKKQYYCEDLVLGWADLLFMKSSRIIISYVCREAIRLINGSVN